MASTPNKMQHDAGNKGPIARHTLGIVLLAITVFFWTASNFLASNIFADHTYSKPYFVTYVTTSMFSVYLIVRLIKIAILGLVWSKTSGSIVPPVRASDETEAFLRPPDAPEARSRSSTPPASSNLPVSLDFNATRRLALEFAPLWFLANFFQIKSLEYTSVASATILFSSSPIWTLVSGHWTGVERFTPRKLIGVVAILFGVALISWGDYSGGSDEHRGSFPHKETSEMALGNGLALLSAVLYGIYTTRFKQRAGDESRVDMLLFLGCVGVLNTFILLPGFVVMDVSGWEKFEWPSTSMVWNVVLVNAILAVISDLTWAYAVVLTTPLIVTVGLSLCIPLSILGQIPINGQGSTLSNWAGAAVVLVAFVIVNQEECNEAETAEIRDRQD